MIKFFAELRRRNVFRVCGTFVVAAWFLVQTAYTLEDVMNLPDWFDGLVLSLSFLGLPVVAVLAWAFELTPEGFKRTEVVSKEESIAEVTGKRLDIAILIGLIIVGSLLLFERFQSPDGNRDRPLANITSLAVLPFENRSEAASDAFFADGMHDELLTALSRLAGLDVISRTSVMGYRDTNKRIPDIALELGVGAVLEGAVQRSGERVRISVQLIDGVDDRQVWAESYDRPLSAENIFDIQAEITRVIAGSLKGVLIEGKNPSEAIDRPTNDVEAYDAYIQAQLLNQPSEQNEGDLRAAIRLYDTALALDPTYGKAWVGKAKARLALYRLHGREAVEREAAQAALDRAKLFAPDYPDTLIWDAFNEYWGKGNLQAADAAFDKALAVSPGNVDALAGKAFLTRSLGDLGEAALALERAHRLDPLSYYLIPELALTYALMGYNERAEIIMDRARAINPDSLQGHAFSAAISQFDGRADDAFKQFEPLAKLLPYEYVEYALRTQNAENVRRALSGWPSATKRKSADWYLAALNSAAILETTEEEISTLKDGLRAFYDPRADWDNPVPERFVLIAGWLGEKARVLELTESYGDRASKDALVGLSEHGDLALALLHVGEVDRAIDFTAKQVELTGPHLLNVYQHDDIYKAARATPRWNALAAGTTNGR